MNIWEEKIRKKEAELHTNLFGVRRGTKERFTKPDVKGYMYEDPMLADWMIWVRNTHHDLRDYIFHVENEGDGSTKYDKMKGSQSLAKGKLSGVLDIECLYYKMVWIEAKLPEETLSPRQQIIWNKWALMGHELYLCDNFDSFKWVIEQRILPFGSGQISPVITPLYPFNNYSVWNYRNG